MTTSTDIIIIGGGIAGTSAAAALAEHNHVVVLEQEAQPGYHSTGRSAATFAPYYGPEIIQQLSALSKPLLTTQHHVLSDQPFTSPKGELMLGRAEDANEIEKHIALGMQPLSLQEAHEYVPLIRGDNISSILYTDNMLDIDVDVLHQSYIKRFKTLGSQLVCNAPVTALHFENNHWQVSAGDEVWHAPIVVNAAGAWADHVAVMAGAKPVGIQPKRRSAALVPYLPDSNMPEWPMVFGAAENFYCTPFGNGLMVSPADATPVDPQDAWPEDMDIAQGIDEFQKYINYDIDRVDHQWAGLRSFAPDGDPVVGFDPDVNGFFWLAGQGGYGIQTSPAMAGLCKQLIQCNENRKGLFDIEAAPSICKQVDPGRFS